MSKISEVLDSPEFASGLEAGLIALAVGLLVGVGWRLLLKRPAPVGGVLLAGAAAAGLADALDLPSGLAWGLVALAVAGLPGDVPRVPPVVGAALAIPGAWLVAARGNLVGVGWVPVAVGVTIVVGGWLAADFDRCHRGRAWSLLLFVISAGGVYLAVPDTEQPLVLLGAAAGVALLSWPVPLASLGSAGAFAATGVLAWTVAVGGRGRSDTIVGGLACLGLLLAEPLARWLLRRRVGALARSGQAWWATLAVAAAHIALVAFASRVVAPRPLSTAVPLAVGALAVAVVVLVVVGRGSPRNPAAAAGADRSQRAESDSAEGV